MRLLFRRCDTQVSRWLPLLLSLLAVDDENKDSAVKVRLNG